MILFFSAPVGAQSVVSPRADASDNRRCLNCHGQERLGTLSPEDRRGMVALPPGAELPARPNPERLFVDPARRAHDVHRDAACIACHADAAILPHPPRLGPAACWTCHPNEAEAVRRGVHSAPASGAGPRFPHCADCHGSHDIRRRGDPESRAFPLNSIRICGDCHAAHAAPSDAGLEQPALVRQYLESVHGRAIKRAGLVVAATCADCHGYHDIRPSRDAESSVHHSRIPGTCGRCHVGIQEVFEKSVHGSAGRAGRTDRPPPVCTDCHTAHAISRADTPAFLRDITGECGTCHTDLYRTYRDSYHGQVQKLGSARAARCSSCHGAHDVLPASHPDSRVAPANLAGTCSSGDCHPALRTMPEQARLNFVEYRPHADYRDRNKDPVLFYIWVYFLIVIGVTFTFWGLHSAAWFARSTIIRLREGPRPRPAAGVHAYERFHSLHRWTHGLVIISFFGLTLTGLPLKFSDQPWAGPLVSLVGGVHAAGALHRFFAVLVLGYIGLHLFHLFRSRRGPATWRQRVLGPNSLLPMARDWRQFTQMVRWFFGRGPKPRFDRWTYWEKFDYWADAVGTVIIGLSGLLLWFPLFFSKHLSGYWFNIATVVHGYEALLAVGFIFTIHFFNAHLRWEKFPVDRVMFTGQISEEEFREERPAQFERLLAGGVLDDLKVRAAPHWKHRLATAGGLVALLIGVSLIVMIVWTGLQ